MGTPRFPGPARRRNLSAGASVEVAGIEVTQCIQNMAHDAPLLAGKPTVVRVYLTPHGQTRSIRVRAELRLRRDGQGGSSFLPSMNSVVLKANDHPSVPQQRRDISQSLNFLLEPEWTDGNVKLVVNRVLPVNGDDATLTGETVRDVGFEAAPVLRVHVIGLRYRDPANDTTHAPDAFHFAHLRSFLTRAFPAGRLEWSQIVVDASPELVPPFSDGTENDPLWRRLLDAVHMQIKAIRGRDVGTGTDPRTHYYGLISDAAEFFRGAASNVPNGPDPSVVAVGPAGVPRGRLGWDQDRSYADWYGMHEIGHTLGARHPGFCGNQRRDPQSTFPYGGGRISDDGDDFIGFDIGQPALNLPMRAYPHETWHDVMTYCENQWPSAHTYVGLLQRLREEDALFEEGHV